MDNTHIKWSDSNLFGHLEKINKAADSANEDLKQIESFLKIHLEDAINSIDDIEVLEKLMQEIDFSIFSKEMTNHILINFDYRKYQLTQDVWDVIDKTSDDTNILIA